MRTARARILFGGSFDPPTLAHRRMLEIVRRRHPGAEIVVIPAGSPPHKQGVTEGSLRLAMARIAFAGLAGVRVSDEECRQPGPSYTVRTLERHAAEIGDGELYWLIGSDSLLDLGNWREPHRILQLAEVLTVPRPGYDVTTLDALTGLTPTERDALRSGVLPASGPAVSSTRARQGIQRGEDVGELVDARVLAFIRERGLYRDA